MPKVSVIVSIHNPGKYLIPMLDSIIYQTFKDLEIFLIDDGSTDGSREIIKQYEQKDNRIITIFREKSENERFGQKYSADLGRSLATGEYIMMLDHDDLLPVDAIEKLYSYTNNGTVDVVQGRNISMNDQRDITFETPDFFPEPTLITDIEALPDYLLALHLVYTPISLWACLIRNEFQKEIELVDCIYNDTDFIWRLKLLAKSFYYIPDRVYIHNDHEDAVSGANNADKNTFETFRMFQFLEQFLHEQKISSNLWDYYFAYKFIRFYVQSCGLTPKTKASFFQQVGEAIKTDRNIAYIFSIYPLDINIIFYYLMLRQYADKL